MAPSMISKSEWSLVGSIQRGPGLKAARRRVEMLEPNLHGADLVVILGLRGVHGALGGFLGGHAAVGIATDGERHGLDGQVLQRRPTTKSPMLEPVGNPRSRTRWTSCT